MNEIELIDKILEEVSKLFPKRCNCCGREFKDFVDFINNTEIPQHAHDENFMIMHLHGIYDILALRNCKCNTTIALPCALDKEFKKQLVTILEQKAKELNISTEKMAGIMRDKIISRAISKDTDKN